MTYKLQSATLPWQYSRNQWHVLCDFASRLRIPDSDDHAHVTRPTVIELYLSYLCVCNGWRFESMIPDEMGGGRVAHQLSGFIAAWRSFTRLTGAQELIPDDQLMRSRLAETSEWGGHHGIPRFALLVKDVLLPRWTETSGYVRDAFAIAMAAPEHSVTCDTELWRRWEPGMPGSQMDLTLAPFEVRRLIPGECPPL